MHLLCTHTHTQFAAAFIWKDTMSTNLMWSTHIQTQQTHGHSDLALVGPLIWRLPVGFVYIYFSIHCFIDFFSKMTNVLYTKTCHSCGSESFFLFCCFVTWSVHIAHPSSYHPTFYIWIKEDIAVPIPMIC